MTKFPTFIWNYLVVSKKVSSYFCGLFRMHELRYLGNCVKYNLSTLELVFLRNICDRVCKLIILFDNVPLFTTHQNTKNNHHQLNFKHSFKETDELNQGLSCLYWAKMKILCDYIVKLFFCHETKCMAYLCINRYKNNCF